MPLVAGQVGHWNGGRSCHARGGRGASRSRCVHAPATADSLEQSGPSWRPHRYDELIRKICNVLRKHSLHGENSSLGFIEAVHQWKFKKPLHWRSRAWAEPLYIFLCKQQTIHDLKDQQNKTIQWCAVTYSLLTTIYWLHYGDLHVHCTIDTIRHKYVLYTNFKTTLVFADRSGMLLHVTRNLRRYDVGNVQIGQNEIHVPAAGEG